MKKLLSTVLALAMLISMLIASSVAFAEEVNVTTSQLSPTSVNVGENASFRVITTTATKFIALFDEEDNMLRSWDAASYAEKSKDKLAWHVMCPMEKAGNISVRFFASADGVDYIPRKNSTTVEVIDAAREITCTDVPAVNKVSQNEYNDVYPYDKLSFSVYTSDNAKFLALFDEAGTKLGSWTAAEFAAYTGNGEMKWTALTRPAMLGMSKCIFKASEDGETYGKEAFSFLNVKTADLSAHTEYLGDWYCVSMIEGGETLNPAEYGMEITLTLNADCTASVDMMGEIETAVWNVNEDGISLMTMNGALQADGTLDID